MTSIDLSNFNTGKVTLMDKMFKGCTNLEYLNVKGFKTEKVTNMNEMFNTIPKVRTLDLSTFDTSSCQRIDRIFEGNNNLKITIRKDKCSNILTGLPEGVSAEEPN